MKTAIRATTIGCLLTTVFLSGCMIKSYPADRLKESLGKICRLEYGIENIDVKMSGDTIGVYLPLNKLFDTDFKEAAVTGKVKNLETLFEPSEEALNKIEDVLFGISRVLLSTDREFKFYVLQATDIKNTGLQLVLSGYVDDIRRVRIWDIPRSEYRKRVVHELKMNRAVKWHEPVKAFFNDIEALNADQIRDLYFSPVLPVEAIQTIFLNKLHTGEPGELAHRWHVLDMRSTALQKNEVIVYTKVLPLPKDIAVDAEALTGLHEDALRFLFTLSFSEDQAVVRRIIPFQYLSEEGIMQKIPFPKELQIEANLDKWEQEFVVRDIEVGPFLANQLTRRVQNLIALDERIKHTFRNIQLSFDYAEGDRGSAQFSLNVEAALSDFDHYHKDSIVFHEDMLYLLQIAFREFVDVLRSYRFDDYENLNLQLAQEVSPWTLGRDELELFRRQKIELSGIFSTRQF